MKLLPLRDVIRAPRSLREARIRARCHTAYLGDNTALCRVLGRYKMLVDTTDTELPPHLMLDGFWEFWVTKAICNLVKPGMVVADIGANHGYFAIVMAELVGPKGHVHAFEVIPRLANLVDRSLAMNGFRANSTVHNVAVGAEDGDEMVLTVPPKRSSQAHIKPHRGGELGKNQSIIETRRLDSKAAWRDIELAKVDIEGAEQLMWSGAKGLLDGSKLKTVLMEFGPARYKDPAGFLAKLQAPGFSLGYIHTSKGIVPASEEQILQLSEGTEVMLALQR